MMSNFSFPRLFCSTISLIFFVLRSSYPPFPFVEGTKIEPTSVRNLMDMKLEQEVREKMIALGSVSSKCLNEGDEDLAEIIHKIAAGIQGGGGEALATVPNIVFDILENDCDASQTDLFHKALGEFHNCSGIDILAYHETFADAVLGIFIQCARYIYEHQHQHHQRRRFLVSTDTNTTSHSPQDLPLLPRVPDQCVDALVGDNPLGNFIHNSIEHPTVDAKCHTTLNQNLPNCTLKQWPIPLPGRILKLSSCISREFLISEHHRSLCSLQLSLLDYCLPTDDPKLYDGKPSDAETCGKWINECHSDFDFMFPPLVVTLPAPFHGLPLANLCSDLAEKYTNSWKKLKGFQQSCVSADDKEFWGKGSGASSLSPLQLDDSDDSSKESTANTSTTDNTTTNSSRKSSSGGSDTNSSSSSRRKSHKGRTSFFLVLIMAIAVAVSNHRRRHSITFVNLENESLVHPRFDTSYIY
jgi:hypothetical protein